MGIVYLAFVGDNNRILASVSFDPKIIDKVPDGTKRLYIFYGSRAGDIKIETAHGEQYLIVDEE